MATGTGPSAPPAPTGHVRWRRRLLILVVLAGGIVALTHRVGGTTMEWVGIGIGGLLLVGGWLVINPWLQHHLHPHGPRQKKSRRGSLNYPGQSGKGLRVPLRPAGRTGSMLGTLRSDRRD